MTAVPRSSAPQAAVANIPRERSTESSDASCELRARSWELLARQLHGRPGVLFHCGRYRGTRAATQAQAPHSSIATGVLGVDGTAKRTKRALPICENCLEGLDNFVSEGGGAAPEVTPRRLHCDVNSTQKIPDLGVGTAPRPCLNKAGKNTIGNGGSSRPGAQEIKRGRLAATRASSENCLSRQTRRQRRVAK